MGVGVSSKVQPILTIMDSMTSEPRAELQAAIDRVGEATLNVRERARAVFPTSPRSPLRPVALAPPA